MAELDINAAKTTDLTNEVTTYSPSSVALDYAGEGKETYWYFKDATKNFGYHKSVPELNSAVGQFSVWVAGKGYEVQNKRQEVILEHITGWGEDSFQSILMNMIVTKKIVGDAFAEIIRNKSGDILNLKVISPERVKIVVGQNGLIKRYEVLNGKDWKKFDTKDIFHICNERVGDEIHGRSIIDPAQFVLDAMMEAIRDERKIKHRELALGVMYVDTDDTSKIAEIKKTYASAIENGEVLILPKDVAELKDANVRPSNRIEWLRYLESKFYQIIKIPRIIATSEGMTEAGAKIGYLTFEPVYIAEQTLLEQDIWNQLAIKITFNRPASLGGVAQQDEIKNSGPTNIQPNDTEAGIGRE